MTSAAPPLPRRLLAEFLGSAFLAAIVIGSGIAAQTLSPHDVGLELLENAAATGAGLFAIILMFGPVSGGQFNPAVSLLDAGFGGIRWRDTVAYIPAQITGGVAAAILANAMFAKAAVSFSTHHRATPSHLLAPAIAIGRTFFNTFAGIAPASLLGFIAAQLIGAAIAAGAIRSLYPDIQPRDAKAVVLPHPS